MIVRVPLPFAIKYLKNVVHESGVDITSTRILAAPPVEPVLTVRRRVRASGCHCAGRKGKSIGATRFATGPFGNRLAVSPAMGT